MDLHQFEGNDKLSQELRKHGSHLTVSGLGIIFFGLWSVIKVFAEVAFGTIDLKAFLMEGLEDTPQMRALMYALFIFILIFIIVFHYYIGRCAIQVGTGKKKRYLFLLLAVLLLIINLMGFDKYWTFDPNVSQLDITLATFLVDVANCAILINMVYTSIMYYRLSKKVEEA